MYGMDISRRFPLVCFFLPKNEDDSKINTYLCGDINERQRI